MHDMIHQYMNRFKICKAQGKMAETSCCDTIQSNLNRIKMLETDFCPKKRTFLCMSTILDTRNKITQGKTIDRVR